MNNTYEFKVLDCNTSKTKSGRVYPKELVINALEDYKQLHTESDVSFMFGQLKTDDNLFAMPSFEVDISLVSHVIKEFTWKDDTLYATIETLDTPNGRTLQNVLDKYSQDGLELMHNAYGDISVVDDIETVTELTFVSFDIVL